MKRSDLSSLDDLRAFEAVARLGSVRAAAESLNLTHGAISRRVTKLSQELGVLLVMPDGRGIAITAEGRVLAEAATKAFEVIGQALGTVRQKDANAPIVLSCERSVAMRWLIPRLSQFQDTHPDIAVHLSVGGGSLDFARDGITLAIRHLDFQLDPDWTVVPLLDEEIGVVMAPQMHDTFWDRSYIALRSKTRATAWSTWCEQFPDVPKPTEYRQFDHHFLLVEAAASGLGVAICPRILGIDDIERGRLIAPLGFVPDGTRYGLIFPKSPEPNTKTHALASWIREVFSSVSV